MNSLKENEYVGNVDLDESFDESKIHSGTTDHLQLCSKFQSISKINFNVQDPQIIRDLILLLK